MRTKNIFKGVATAFILCIGMSLNATLASISVSGFVSSDEGESLSSVSVSCPTNQSVKSTETDGTGFYSISGLSHNDVLSYSCSGFNTENRTISNTATSQSIDVEMSSSSSSR